MDNPQATNYKELQVVKTNKVGVLPHIENPEVRVEIPAETRRIYRVSPHLRGDTSGQVYDPVVLSLGPYHHGNPQFHQMEGFKAEQLKSFVSDSIAIDADKGGDFFRWQIMEVIQKIRESYEQVGYDDEALANIILCDACFLIRYMEMGLDMFSKVSDDYGMPTAVLMDRDMLLLENQVPFWIIKRLLYSRFGEDEADKLFNEFLSAKCYVNSTRKVCWKDDRGREPLHLLDAYRISGLQQEAGKETTMKMKPHFRTRIFQRMKTWTNWRRNDVLEESTFERLNLPCRSVTYLQAKGIYFRPSSSCLKDIRFTSYHFYGTLHLPIVFIGAYAKVYTSNVIAFEMSPKNSTDHETMSIVNFMKSLIETPEDVKELRKGGILFGNLGSDEQVVKLFKEMETYGLGNYDMFASVKVAINRHCDNKAKNNVLCFHE